MTWVLAVDFGTTNTVAAVADATGVRVLNVNGRPVMASAVFLHDDGWYVGDAAVRMARHRLDRFEACPKRAIPDQTLFLGGVDVPVTDAITALFRPLLAEALEQHGGKPPDLLVVTHPATWTASRIELLLSAAAAAAPGKAKWPNPQALAEPVAAAQRVLRLENMPATSRLVVLDLGGGTTDVTVVDRHGDRLNVVGNPLGHDGLGGVDFDLRLARWMVAEVNAPGLYDRLANATDPELRERAVDIREHARDVKEQLSRQPVVPAQLPKSPPELPSHTPVQVSRAMLESLIRGSEQEPGLEQAVGLVNDALLAAPPGPEMAGVFLVGGSSRIPLLGVLVTQRTGRVPLQHGDPTTAVAEGAARHGWDALHGEPDPSDPPPPDGRKPGGPPPGFPEKKFPAIRTKIALLVTLLLLLAGGGIFTYVQVSESTTTTTTTTSYTPPTDSSTTDSPTTDSPTIETDEPGEVTESEEVTETDEPEESTETTVYVGTMISDVMVYEQPWLYESTLDGVYAGETVEIYCTVQGEYVRNPETGQASDLWNGIGDGFVPDVYVDTGTAMPTMPPCSTI